MAVMLSPDSDYGVSHEWPIERWQEVGESLKLAGKRITVAGVNGGRNLGKILAEKLGDGVEFFHAAPLSGVLPLLAVHGLIIAADGSLPHLASHAGCGVRSLFATEVFVGWTLSE